MEELILVRSQLKAELAKQQYIKEQWKKNYEKQKFQSILEELRYTEGIINGLEKSIKLLSIRIEGKK